jgi:hypothetical protein
VDRDPPTRLGDRLSKPPHIEECTGHRPAGFAQQARVVEFRTESDLSFRQLERVGIFRADESPAPHAGEHEAEFTSSAKFLTNAARLRENLAWLGCSIALRLHQHSAQWHLVLQLEFIAVGRFG